VNKSELMAYQADRKRLRSAPTTPFDFAAVMRQVPGASVGRVG
jgi:hypothetical protein